VFCMIQHVFFAGTKNKFDLSKINQLRSVFLLLIIYELIFVGWGSYSNSVCALRQVFIVLHSYQTCFGFLEFVVNLVVGCMIKWSQGSHQKAWFLEEEERSFGEIGKNSFNWVVLSKVMDLFLINFTFNSILKGRGKKSQIF